MSSCSLAKAARKQAEESNARIDRWINSIKTRTLSHDESVAPSCSLPFFLDASIPRSKTACSSIIASTPLLRTTTPADDPSSDAPSRASYALAFVLDAPERASGRLFMLFPLLDVIAIVPPEPPRAPRAPLSSLPTSLNCAGLPRRSFHSDRPTSLPKALVRGPSGRSPSYHHAWY